MMTNIFVNWSLWESSKEDFQCLVETYIPREEQTLNQFLILKLLRGGITTTKNNCMWKEIDF